MILVTFHVTDIYSFNNVKNWLNDIKRCARDNVITVLIGTKADLTTKRTVDRPTAEEFAKAQNLSYFETSAKTGLGIKEVFSAISDKLLELHGSSPTPLPLPKPSLRTQLIEDLKNYILSIERHKNPNDPLNPDFSFGFTLFKATRAVSREANYYLAQKLLANLNDSNQDILTIFSGLEKQRTDIIAEKNLHLRPDFKNRGINDEKLNAIINTVLTSQNNRPSLP